MTLTQGEVRKRQRQLYKKLEPIAIAIYQLRLNCLHNRLKTYKSGFQECRDCGKEGIYPPSHYDKILVHEQRLFNEGKIKKLVISQKDIRKQYKELLKKVRPIAIEFERLRKACKHPNMEFGGSSGDSCPDCGIYIP